MDMTNSDGSVSDQTDGAVPAGEAIELPAADTTAQATATAFVHGMVEAAPRAIAWLHRETGDLLHDKHISQARRESGFWVPLVAMDPEALS